MSQLPKNKAGQLTIPASKPKSAKVWMTVQVSRSFRNVVTKIAEQNNVNISSYIRKKLVELVAAAKNGRLHKGSSEIICPKCKEKISLNEDDS